MGAMSRGCLSSEVPYQEGLEGCAVRFNALWAMGPPVNRDRQIRLKTLPSRKFVGGR